MLRLIDKISYNSKVIFEMLVIILITTSCKASPSRSTSLPTVDLSKNLLLALCHLEGKVALINAENWNETGSISNDEFHLASDLALSQSGMLYITRFGDGNTLGEELISVNLLDNDNLKLLTLPQAPFRLAINSQKAVATHTAQLPNNKTKVSFVDIANNIVMNDYEINGLASSVKIYNKQAYILVGALTKDQTNTILVYDLDSNKLLTSFNLIDGDINLGSDFGILDKRVYYQTLVQNSDGILLHTALNVLDMETGENSTLSSFKAIGDIYAIKNHQLVLSPGIYGQNEPVRLVDGITGTVLQESVFDETANNLEYLSNGMFAITLENTNEILIFSVSDNEMKPIKKIKSPCTPFVLDLFYYEGYGG